MSQKNVFNNTLYVFSTLIFFTMLTNKGWLPYVHGITRGYYYGIDLLLPLAYYLFLLLSLLIIFLTLTVQLFRLGLKPFWALRGRALLIFSLATASLFTPQKAELFFHLWRQDFIEVVNTMQHQDPADYDSSLFTTSHYILGNIKSSRYYGCKTSPQQTSKKEPCNTSNILVFSYGYGTAALVYNEHDMAYWRETSVLCDEAHDEGGYLKRIEKNWFLCNLYTEL